MTSSPTPKLPMPFANHHPKLSNGPIMINVPLTLIREDQYIGLTDLASMTRTREEYGRIGILLGPRDTRVREWTQKKKDEAQMRRPGVAETTH